MLGAVQEFETEEKILLLADSKAAISAVKKAGKTGKARTGDLVRLMEAIGKRESEVRGAVALGWVKSHIGVHGNEITDEMAKKGAQERVGVLQVTEGGIRQKIKKWRRDVRQVEGFGKGKMMSWARRTATTYSQLRTNKGALQAWRYKIGKAESPECRHCGKAESPECRHCGKAAETGDHLVFVC